MLTSTNVTKIEWISVNLALRLVSNLPKTDRHASFLVIILFLDIVLSCSDADSRQVRPL
jgi:hypothetical protein